MPKTGTKEFLKKMAEISERIRAEVQPFEDMSPAASLERKLRAEHDDLYFAKTYFPHDCSDEFAPFHKEMLALAGEKNKIICIAGFRGCSKTGLIGKISRIKKAVYRQRRHFAVVAETEDMAMERTGEIRVEFETNSRLIADFGDLRSIAPWEYDNFVLSNGARFKAYGWRSRIRSRKRGAYRVDDICVDDYEDPLGAYNPVIVDKKYKRLKQDFLGATNLIDYDFTFLGNYFSKISVIHKLMEDPEVRHVIYRAEDKAGNPSWPQRYPRKVLDSLKKNMGSVIYDIEMLQHPRDDETSNLKEKWIKEWTHEQVRKRQMRRFGFLDPSMRKGESNDFKAIVCLNVSLAPLEYLAGRCWIRRASVEEMVDEIFRIYKEEKLERMGIEGNDIRDYLEPLILAKARRSGWHPCIEWIDSTVNKEVRILPRFALIERGIARFQAHNSDQNILLEQMKFFPTSGIKDDGPDAWASCISLAERNLAGSEYIAVKRSGGIAGLFRKGAW